MMYNYTVVSGYNQSKFEERVKRLMEEGWELVGGVVVSTYREEYDGNKIFDHFYQAMKKTEKD